MDKIKHKRNRALKDYSGMVFSRLTAIHAHPKIEGKPVKWHFMCECGNVCDVTMKLVVSGHTKSCGCLAREKLIERNTTHGLAKQYPKTYRTWKDMRARCNNPNNTEFHNYGGRGITICKQWDDFAVFFADMGARPEGLSIERINVNGNYEPTNCKWADIGEQANNKQSSIRITHNGETKTMTQWARQLGKAHGTLAYRIAHGLEVVTIKDYRIEHSKT
jgi:hypothetical protein